MTNQIIWRWLFLNLFSLLVWLPVIKFLITPLLWNFVFELLFSSFFFGGKDWEEERSKNQSAFEKKSNRGPIFYLYTLKICSMRSVCKWRKKLISGEKSTVEKPQFPAACILTRDLRVTVPILIDTHFRHAVWTVEIAVPARVL